MVTVERFEPNPEHGRPEIARFTGPEGRLSVHCDRASGSLWLFAVGPRGGDRGEVICPISRRLDLEGWLDGARASYFGARHWMRWRDETELIIAKSVMGRHFRMRFDEAAREEFMTCVRAWAQAAGALGDG